MTARAIWKGILTTDGSKLFAVKLYTAVNDVTIRFHLLHKLDHVRLAQRMVNPESGETIPVSSAMRGVDLGDGRFVVLDDQDLQSIEPTPSRDIHCQHAIPLSEIDAAYFDRAYYLGPDGNSEEYFALASILERQSLALITEWVMRKQEYTGALISRDGYLMLVTLRHAGEVIAPAQLAIATGRDLDRKEIQLAQQLIEALEGEFDPDAYHDEYRLRVKELITAKHEGKIFKIEHYRAPKSSEDSLAESLSASLKAVR